MSVSSVAPASRGSLGRRVAAGLAGLSVAAGLSLAATPAQAVVAAPAEDASVSALYYGAISVNRATGAVGSINNQRSQRAAVNGAQARCKKSAYGNKYCANAVWVRSGCAAVAIRYNAQKKPVYFGAAYAASKKTANALAVKRAGKGSKVVSSLCTRR